MKYRRSGCSKVDHAVKRAAEMYGQMPSVAQRMDPSIAWQALHQGTRIR